MFGHELYKVVSNRAIMFLAAAVLVLNMFLLWQFEKDRTEYSADEYMAEWEEITLEAGVSGWEAVIRGLDEKLKEFDTEGLNARERFALRNSSTYYRKSLYEDIKAELLFQTDYEGYLDGIEAAADRFSKIMLFGKVDGYSYRDIMKMKEAYADIERISLTPEPSAGVEMAAASGITDILAFVVLLCVAVTVWLKEKEQGMMLLLRTTYRGRVRLAVCKLAVMLAACIFLGVGLYGGNVIMASVMYGLGDLTRPLASVYDYGHTLWEIRVWEFLLLNMAFKIAAYIWVSLLISAVCCKFSNSVAAFGTTVIFGGAGCLMYYRIPYLSVMVAFKYLNPFAVLKTELLFADYNGLNFFQYPVDYRLCMAVMLPAGIILFTLLTVRFFTDYVIKSGKKGNGIFMRMLRSAGGVTVKLRRRLEAHTSLPGHELHRIFVCHGAFIVLLVSALFIAYDSRPYDVRYFDLAYYCEHLYLDRLKGPVTDETYAFIETEEERLSDLSDDYAKAEKRALSMIRARIAYVNENEGACLMYDAPHNLLTAYEDNKTDMLRAAVCMIPVVLVMPCFFAPDLQSGVTKITHVTKRGKRGLGRIRYITGTVLAVVIALAAHLPYFRQTMVSYGADPELLSYPLNSLRHMSAFGNVMGIGTYYVIIYALKVVFTVLGAFLIYWLSGLIRSQAYTILAGFMVLVMPVLAALYDMRLEPVMRPYSAMLGNMFMQEGTAAIVCVASAVIVAVLIKLTGRIRARKG